MPRPTPEQQAITKWQNQVKRIDARVELFKVEREQYMRLIGEMQQRIKSSGGAPPMEHKKA